MDKRKKHIIVWSIAGIVLLALLVAVNRYDADNECSKLELSIDNNDQYCFISEEDLMQSINETGEELVGRKESELELDVLERMLEDMTYVREADVYMTVDGIVKVNVEQRRPLIRVSNKHGETYYLDDVGRVLPLNKDYASRVIYANGYIPESVAELEELDMNMDLLPDSLQETMVHYKLFVLAEYIRQDEFLHAMIDQIYVNRQGEFEMVPQLGDHLILLDDPLDEMELKFNNLKIFYRQGLNRVGWDRYGLVNISIKNQVVCTLKDSLR